jgi:hypothetical protein
MMTSAIDVANRDPLEHLPSAAFSTTKRRAARAAAKAPDSMHPELPLVFAGGKGGESRLHLNPSMITPPVISVQPSGRHDPLGVGATRTTASDC